MVSLSGARIQKTDGSRGSLTAHGKALVRPVADIWSHVEARLVAGLTETEQALLRRLLMQVLTNLS